MTSLHKTSTPPSSTNMRFLGVLNQPDNDSNPFELDESEVVWSSYPSDSGDRSPPTASNSPTSLFLHQFHSEKSGLSAAFFEYHQPLIRSKPTLNPSLSVASAIRTISPVPLLSSEGPNGAAASAGKFPQSAPVNVPIWTKKVGDFGVISNLRHFDEIDDDDEMEEEEELVPPHEIVARSHVATFSVFEGVGRTLKGSDLRRVRNAVFQKTGFLD